MLIESIFSQVIETKASLRDRLLQECTSAGISAEDAEALLSDYGYSALNCG
jgi:hypothetical protein